MVIDLNNVDISIYDKTITTIDSLIIAITIMTMMVMMLLPMFFVRCKLIQLCCQDEMRIGTYESEKG